MYYKERCIKHHLNYTIDNIYVNSHSIIPNMNIVIILALFSVTKSHPLFYVVTLYQVLKRNL
nr:MAG TPA: hypothetical protein [Caudoviricetes sp.]